MPIGTMVRYWARWQPDEAAVVWHDQTLSWRELLRRGEALAAGLNRHGVRRGDRVAILMENRPEYTEFLVACALSGYVGVPLNIRLTPTEIAYQVEHSEASVILTEPTLLAGCAEARTRNPRLETVCAGSSADGCTGYEHLLTEPGAPPGGGPSPDDTFLICYTSGTTGAPKGAMLSHANWRTTSMFRAMALGITSADRLYLPFPLAFAGGMAMGLLCLWTGCTLYLDETFDAERCLDVFERERITTFMAIPAIFAALAAHPRFRDTDLSSLRVASGGGAPVPRPLLVTFQERGVPMVQSYALTEAAASGLVLHPRDSLTKLGAAGLGSPWSTVRILDADMHEALRGTVGEICIRGPEVMQGYWRDPEETAATLVDGWCRTGDLGYMDDDGYIFVVDRVKDMLISGGLNVYPAEIESVLSDIPEIVEVAVVGVPHEKWGETPAVVAYTDGKPLDGADVLAACRGKLAGYKIPRYLVLADEPLPRNMSGKLLKPRIRERYAARATASPPIR